MDKAEIPENIGKIINFIKKVFVKFYRDRCLIRASGMAYSSLLALVPLSALVFSLLTAFGVFDRLKESIQALVFQQLLPTRQNEVISYINIFIENTKTLGVVGLLLFTLTSVLLISNIQGNFNDIWNVRKKRNFFNQFSVYISVILISTLFIGAGFVISGWIKSAAAEITFLKINLVIQFLITFSPKVFFSFNLFILILAVPSTRVRISGAFAGALSGGLLMWVVKHFFASWSATAVRYSVIYGSIALIPIFLIWLYIIWLVILLSVEISCVWQNRAILEIKSSEMPLFRQFRDIFDIYLLVAENYLDNKGGITAEEVSEKAGDNGNIYMSLSFLEKSDLVYRIEEASVRYIPVTPPHTTLTGSVVGKICGTGPGEGLYSRIYERITEYADDFFSIGENRYISELLNYSGRELPDNRGAENGSD